MNKFYTLILIAIVAFFGYGIYDNAGKSEIKKERRIACQNKTITFENISQKELIPEAIALLKTNNYKVISRIELSKYMETKILNHISIEEADKFLENSIKKIAKTNTKSNSDENLKKLIIDYYIYENDKEDKGKKSDKAKLYAGYLVFSFKLDNKLIYKIQTDFMKMDTSDIPERMDCIIESFITLKGK